MIAPIQQALLITYDLKAPGQDYANFYNALKTQGSWWHYLSNTWIVITHKSSHEVYMALGPYLTKADFILVVPVRKPAFGWLPKAAWDWINNNLPAG